MTLEAVTNWKQSTAKSTGIECYNFEMMNTKRKRKVFYFELEQPKTLKVAINIGAANAPQNVDDIRNNSLTELTSSHSGEEQHYTTTFIDALILSTLLPQFINAICSEPKLWSLLYKEKLPSSPSKKTIWAKRKVQDVARVLPFDYIEERK